MKIILEAIVGSHAYGLETEDSDKDILGIYLATTEHVLSLDKPKGTLTKTDPDLTYHELEKFMSLAAKCNPTILELLFMDEYTKITMEGQLLVDLRHAFFSKVIYKSYGGYAISQARKLNARYQESGEASFGSSVKNRYAKHARHCFRLLDQGAQLLETMTLDVKVKNRDELFALGELPVDELIGKFEAKFKEFDKIKTDLPDDPDWELINKVLLTIRALNLNAGNI